MLAEDGPDSQALPLHILVRAGLEVQVAANGIEAHALAMKALLAGTPFDVVLMGMQMSVMTSDEAVHALRADAYEGPIIALTAQALAGDREACLAAGCDDYATSRSTVWFCSTCSRASWRSPRPESSGASDRVLAYDRGRRCRCADSNPSAC